MSALSRIGDPGGVTISASPPTLPELSETHETECFLSLDTVAWVLARAEVRSEGEDANLLMRERSRWRFPPLPTSLKRGMLRAVGGGVCR